MSIEQVPKPRWVVKCDGEGCSNVTHGSHTRGIALRNAKRLGWSVDEHGNCECWECKRMPAIERIALAKAIDADPCGGINGQCVAGPRGHEGHCEP